MFSLLSKFFSKAGAGSSTRTLGSLDYDKLIQLDAECLAEQGIADAYQLLLPALREYVDHTAEVSETLDADLPTYTIQFNSIQFNSMQWR